MRTQTTKTMDILLEADEALSLLRGASILGDLIDRMEEERLEDLYLSLGNDARGVRFDLEALQNAYKVCLLLSDEDYILSAVD